MESKKFKEMLEWLNPTFDDAKLIYFNFSLFLSVLSANSSDCSEAALFGQKLNASLSELENQITIKRNEDISGVWPNLSYFNKSFQSGLNLRLLEETDHSWSIYCANKPEWARLTYVLYRLPVSLKDKFEKIEIFIWR